MRAPEKGVVLIYVLVVLAVSSAVVVAMVGRSEQSITSGRLFADAAQAQALVSAGEASAIAALRRDPPEIDHRNEGWAKVAQADLAIAGGRFQLEISDAQGRYNLTNLAAGGVLAQDRLRAILAALDLEPGLAPRLVAAFASEHPPQSLRQVPGLTPTDLAALDPLVTVLPLPAEVNINAAPVRLLAALLANPVQARKLALRRDAQGFLTLQDVAGMGVILPPGIGVRSDFFALRVTVQMGDALGVTDSLIWRKPEGVVRVVRRQREALVPEPPAP